MSQYFNQPEQPPEPAQRGTQPVTCKPALMAMIFGIISILTFFCPVVGPIAILLGIIGMFLIKGSEAVVDDEPTPEVEAAP